MAELKKETKTVAEPEVKPAEKTEAPKAAKTAKTAKAPAKKPAAKKAPVKKEAAKKAPAEKKTRAPRKPKTPEITLDTLTTKLWDKLTKSDVTKISDVVAVQVNVWDMGTFFIAIKNGTAEITQDVYVDRNGTIETNAESVLKIAAGGFDYKSALKSGMLNYYGDLAKAMVILDFFK